MRVPAEMSSVRYLTVRINLGWYARVRIVEVTHLWRGRVVESHRIEPALITPPSPSPNEIQKVIVQVVHRSEISIVSEVRRKS